MAGRYGQFQVSGYEPPTRETRDRERPDLRDDVGITDADIFGTGLYLTPMHAEGINYDLSTTGSGSLRLTSGVEHFASDLSVKLSEVSEELLGTLQDPNDVADFRTDIVSLLQRDDRVRTVNSVGVSRDPIDADTVVVETDLTSVNDNRHTIRTPVATPDTGSAAQLSALS